MKKRFPLIAKLCLISLYVIFLAGSIVRMTGSGMGCPDWPKCFGYYIPPTSEDQLLWKPNTEFKKGAVIIQNESLFVSQNNVQTSNTFNSENWEQYKKHDYAIFNVYHTWTEYINRLASVISGFFFLFLIAGGVKFWKSDKLVTILSFTAFILMLFEAWLGKTVVDSVLKPTTITIHMVVGLVIVAIMITIIQRVKPQQISKYKSDSVFNKVIWLASIMTLIQIALGTQVRQFIDEQVHLLGFENKQLSLLEPDLTFYIHRSFTILIILINVWLYYKSTIKNYPIEKFNWILIILGLETLTGILMYYVDFPLGTQTIHLLLGVFLFSIQFSLILTPRSKE